MGHFYGTIFGNRGPATRCGSKSSGITASAFGWGIGGTVECKYNKELDTDIVYLYTTKDDNRTKSLVASFAIIDGNLTCIETKLPELLI